MIKLAEGSGIVIHEAGNKVYISKRRATWTSTFLFVTGLLAVILLANGVLQFTVFKEQANGSPTAGLVLAGMGILFSILFWRVWLYQKKVSVAPLSELKTIAIFDFGTNNLLDGQQNLLAPINQAFLVRKMQLTSSSPELIIHWGSGSLSIARGNPFSGGIAGIEKALVSKGIRKR